MPASNAAPLAEVVGRLEAPRSKVGECEEMLGVGVPWLESMEATGEEVCVVEHVVVEVIVDQLPQLGCGDAGGGRHGNGAGKKLLWICYTGCRWRRGVEKESRVTAFCTHGCEAVADVVTRDSGSISAQGVVAGSRLCGHGRLIVVADAVVNLCWMPRECAGGGRVQ